MYLSVIVQFKLNCGYRCNVGLTLNLGLLASTCGKRSLKYVSVNIFFNIYNIFIQEIKTVHTWKRYRFTLSCFCCSKLWSIFQARVQDTWLVSVKILESYAFVLAMEGTVDDTVGRKGSHRISFIIVRYTQEFVSEFATYSVLEEQDTWYETKCQKVWGNNVEMHTSSNVGFYCFKARESVCFCQWSLSVHLFETRLFVGFFHVNN